jgi:hypothetical protein
MAALALILPLADTAAEEGKKVITAMLLTGLIFVGVVVLGDLWHYYSDRRRAARRRRKPVY